MKKRLFKARFVVVAISLAFALTVSEITLRALDFRPGTMDPEMYVANADPLLPFKLRPNYNGYCAGRLAHTDADGYRIVSPNYREVHQGQQPNRTILILGDSGVFGFGVADSETIASQLQQACVKKSLNYEIKNVGVSGYTSWNEYEALNDYLKKHSASDVILFYMPNDLTFDNDYFGIGRGQTASFSRGENSIHRWTRLLYSHVYVSYLLSDGLKRIGAKFNQQAAGVAFEEKQKQPEIDYSMHALEKIQELGKARNINFLVGIYRDVAYFDDPSGWLRYETAIESNLDRRGIKWFVAKSHIDSLKASEVRSSWNDPHPGAKAIGFIVGDVLGAVGGGQ